MCNLFPQMATNMAATVKNRWHCVDPRCVGSPYVFPHSGLPTSKGPLRVIGGGFFCYYPCVCVSELSSPSCFANSASFDTIFGRHNRLSPKMLITEWSWDWPQRSRSASVCVSVRTYVVGQLRQFYGFWSFVFYTATLKPQERHYQHSFPKWPIVWPLQPYMTWWVIVNRYHRCKANVCTIFADAIIVKNWMNCESIRRRS